MFYIELAPGSTQCAPRKYPLNSKLKPSYRNLEYGIQYGCMYVHKNARREREGNEKGLFEPSCNIYQEDV